MGEIGKGWEPPAFPESAGPLGRCFHLYVFIAALPYVRAYHRELGIPDDVSRRTLADLGRHVSVHHRRLGTPGLLFPWWIALHFHGELFQLGGCSSSARGSDGARGGPSRRRASTPAPATPV